MSVVREIVVVLYVVSVLFLKEGVGVDECIEVARLSWGENSIDMVWVGWNMRVYRLRRNAVILITRDVMFSSRIAACRVVRNFNRLSAEDRFWKFRSILATRSGFLLNWSPAD